MATRSEIRRARQTHLQLEICSRKAVADHEIKHPGSEVYGVSARVEQSRQKGEVIRVELRAQHFSKPLVYKYDYANIWGV